MLKSKIKGIESISVYSLNMNVIPSISCTLEPEIERLANKEWFQIICKRYNLIVLPIGFIFPRRRLCFYYPNHDEDITISKINKKYEKVMSEIYKYINDFYDSYKKSLVDYTDKMGVWISRFFASGKSHFLKILSYLLENKLVDNKYAVEYFNEKIKDPMLIADMRKSSDITTDVILFNIDSKSESQFKSSTDAILKVFNKVFLYKLL